MNYEQDNDSYFENIFTNNQPGYKYANTDSVSLNQDFTYQLSASHLLSFGALYSHLKSIPVGADLPSPYDESKNPNEQGLNYVNTDIAINFFEHSHETYGGYLQDNWRINDRWKLISGLRYDYNTQYKDVLIPRINLIYKASERDLFKFLYGHAFLAPSGDFTYRHFGSFDGSQNGSGEWISGFFHIPNPELKPEKIKTLEMTYEHWFEKKAYIKLAPYYTIVTDMIQEKSDDIALQVIEGAELLNTQRYVNSGKSKTYGLDISLSQENTISNIEIKNWLNFSFIAGKTIEGGITKELPLISPYKLKGGSTLILLNKYTITPKFYWIGSTQSNAQNPNDETKRIHIPSYILFDLFAEVKLTQNLRLQTDIYNLFDKKISHAPSGSTTYSTPEAPQLQRLITIGLNYKF